MISVVFGGFSRFREGRKAEQLENSFRALAEATLVGEIQGPTERNVQRIHQTAFDFNKRYKQFELVKHVSSND